MKYMGIKDLFKKDEAKLARFRELKTEMEIRKLIEERQKSANERELERFYEEERQKKIARNLEEFRKYRNKQSQKTTVLAGKNIFKGPGNMMKDGGEVLKNNKKLLSMGMKNKHKGMFFK